MPAGAAEIEAHYPGRLEVIEGDALKTDFEALAAGKPVKIIANLPYNVGTQLLVNWLLPRQWPPFWSSLTLMFQKEVGQRIVAREDDNHYGRLGVLCGWRTEAHMAFDIPPQAFTPPPKVTSTVVHLEPRPTPLPCDPDKTGASYHCGFRPEAQDAPAKREVYRRRGTACPAEIDPQRRAETLSVEEFCRIANLL